MRALVLVAIVVAPALAGCLADSASAPGSPADATRRPIDLPWTGTGCIEVFLGVVVDPDHADRFLPAGFRSQVPTGHALVAINGVQCGDSTLEEGPLGFAELIITIEPPTVEGAEVETADRSAYLVHEYVTGSRLPEATNGTGFAVSGIALEAEFTATAGDAALTGRGVLTDAEGEVARFEVTAVPAPPESSAANQFQVTPGGLAVHRVAWRDASVSAGTATCTLREGSLIAEVLGTTTCEAAQAVGILMGPFDAEARFRHVPGATVVGGDA